MKHKQLILFSAALLVIFLALGSYNHQEAEELVTMDTSAFTKLQRSAAVFDHDEHNSAAELEEDCSICHHVYEEKTLVEGESSEDSACVECHSLKPTSENSVALRTAYHNKCKSCHFESAKGPVLCGECHIRKK